MEEQAAASARHIVAIEHRLPTEFERESTEPADDDIVAHHPKLKLIGRLLIWLILLAPMLMILFVWLNPE